MISFAASTFQIFLAVFGLLGIIGLCVLLVVALIETAARIAWGDPMQSDILRFALVWTVICASLAGIFALGVYFTSGFV